MSEKTKKRVFTRSPLPPVLHGVKLNDPEVQKKVNGIHKSHVLNTD